MKKFITISFLFLSMPVLTSAQLGGTANLLQRFGALIQYSIGLLAAVALLIFFWGLVKVVRKAGEGDVKEGKAIMGWGLIALFVMMSVWGIVRFFQGELLPGVDFSNPSGASIQNGSSNSPYDGTISI